METTGFKKYNFSDFTITGINVGWGFTSFNIKMNGKPYVGTYKVLNGGMVVIIHMGLLNGRKQCKTIIKDLAGAHIEKITNN